MGQSLASPGAKHRNLAEDEFPQLVPKSLNKSSSWHQLLRLGLTRNCSVRMAMDEGQKLLAQVMQDVLQEHVAEEITSKVPSPEPDLPRSGRFTSRLRSEMGQSYSPMGILRASEWDVPNSWLRILVLRRATPNGMLKRKTRFGSWFLLTDPFVYL
eukprot:Skav233707  [mRNA]  locus=scaffold1927:458280:459266:+ [translate_table: standard]